MEQSNEEVIDAATLRKIDPEFKQLITTASQVVVYRYNSKARTPSWDKTDIVGCSFLYGRKGNPQYGLVVINHKKSNNYFQTFGPGALFVMVQPYILIRAVEDLHTDPRKDFFGGMNPIHCLRFFHLEDCITSANVLRNMNLKYEGEGETFDKVGESRCHLDMDSPSSGGNHVGNHLFQILRQGKGLEMTYAENLSNSLSAEELGSKMQKVSFEEVEPRVAPLTEDQLHQGFVYLLQNDRNFVKKLHGAYLKSLRQKAASGRR